MKCNHKNPLKGLEEANKIWYAGQGSDQMWLRYVEFLAKSNQFQALYTSTDRALCRDVTVDVM